jgi:hypothetical protein
MNQEKKDKLFNQIKTDEEIFLGYLRSKFPFFHKANFFFRDLEYGLKSYLEKRSIIISSADNLELTTKLASHFEEKGYLKSVNNGVWMINMPQFVTTKPGDPF